MLNQNSSMKKPSSILKNSTTDFSNISRSNYKSLANNSAMNSKQKGTQSDPAEEMLLPSVDFSFVDNQVNNSLLKSTPHQSANKEMNKSILDQICTSVKKTICKIQNNPNDENEGKILTPMNSFAQSQDSKDSKLTQNDKNDSNQNPIRLSQQKESYNSSEKMDSPIPQLGHLSPNTQSSVRKKMSFIINSESQRKNLLLVGGIVILVILVGFGGLGKNSAKKSKIGQYEGNFNYEPTKIERFEPKEAEKIDHKMHLESDEFLENIADQCFQELYSLIVHKKESILPLDYKLSLVERYQGKMIDQFWPYLIYLVRESQDIVEKYDKNSQEYYWVRKP